MSNFIAFLIAILVVLFIGFTGVTENFTDSELATSAYFSPWWRAYFRGPYYGTSATAFNQLMEYPYSSTYWREPDSYYNYWSYWRRPLFYNYWRRPYFYTRPVSPPYVRDSIPGRRERLRRFNFGEQNFT